MNLLEGDDGYEYYDNGPLPPPQKKINKMEWFMKNWLTKAPSPSKMESLRTGKTTVTQPLIRFPLSERILL
jgi:hypothetical protein